MTFTSNKKNLAQWRHDTPGCEKRIHLNNAGAALMPAVVFDAIHNHLLLELEIGGYEAAEQKSVETERVYSALARLMKCDSRNVAIMENATTAFFQAVSAFNLGPGDVVVTTKHDYVASQLLFLSLKKTRGVVVNYCDDAPEGGADVEHFDRLIHNPHCRVATVSWIPTNSGLIQDVHAMGVVCKNRGIPLIVDACQAVGMLPIDAQYIGCDFLVGTARKFLRGPRGLGFLYVSSDALDRGLYPTQVDSRGAIWKDVDAFEVLPTARRFENWEFPYSLVLGLGSAAEYCLAQNPARTGARACELARLTRHLLASVPDIRILDRGNALGAIVSVGLCKNDPHAVALALRNRRINTSVSKREWALFDLTRDGFESILRISPHYYNTEEEIRIAVSELAGQIKSA
jgi:selenocysteine lyase/cysteine desulfurase